MSGEAKSAAELAVEMKAAFEAKFDAVKAIAEDALGKAKDGEKLSQSMKDKADDALTELGGLKSSLEELEQKLDRTGGGNATEVKSVGSQFTESEDFQRFKDNPRKSDSAELMVKADLTTTTGGAGGMGSAVHSNHLPGIAPLPQRRMTVRGLLMPGQTDQPNIDYDRDRKSVV